MVGTVWSHGPTFITGDVTVGGGAGVPKTYIFNVLTGATATLPAATGTGHCYRFIVGLTVTSNAYIIATASDDDEFQGTILQTDTDTTDTLVSRPGIAADNFDAISLNGSTTGGLAGDWIEICDVATGIWAVWGHVNGNGTVATPIS